MIIWRENKNNGEKRGKIGEKNDPLRTSAICTGAQPSPLESITSFSRSFFFFFFWLVHLLSLSFLLLALASRKDAKTGCALGVALRGG